MNLQRDQLRALAAVVDAGTFEAAARALHVTTSAVSQRVKALETAAGQVLVRRTKPVEVTVPGRAILRLARQEDLLEREALAALGVGRDEPVPIPVAVNADSLETWALPALVGAAVEHGACLDLRREDQDRTATLLADGTVTAAITSRSRPVPGCAAVRLGVMRYVPVASAAFASRWFPHGADPGSLALAPVVVFDRSDRLLDRYLRHDVHPEARPPRNYVPGSWDYARAIELGLGWGLLPEDRADLVTEAGALHRIAPDTHVDTELFWQHGKLHSTILDALTEAVTAAAARTLRRPGPGNSSARGTDPAGAPGVTPGR